MKLSEFKFKGENRELDETARASAPGKFIQLPSGYTHYEHEGSESNTPVVLIHGFSIPYQIWDPTFSALRDAGFQVLRYDLLGRGFSDRPNTTYDLDLYVNQLRSLVEHLELKTPLNLIGLSMGGPISISFCNRFPHLVHKLCLIDPAGVPMTSSITGRFFTRPWIGEVLFSLVGNRVLLSELTMDLTEPEKFPAYFEMAKSQIQFKGYKRALLSTLRNDALSDISSLYREVGGQDRELLLIWGTEDRLIPIEQSEIIRDAFPRVEFHEIAGTGHIPHFEKPEEVNPILIEFLKD